MSVYKKNIGIEHKQADLCILNTQQQPKGKWGDQPLSKAWFQTVPSSPCVHPTYYSTGIFVLVSEIIIKSLNKSIIEHLIGKKMLTNHQ